MRWFLTSVLVLVGVVAGSVAYAEVKATHFEVSDNPELVTLVTETVINLESPTGSHINEVSEVICPHVTRASMDGLVASPGSLDIRSHPSYSPPDGPGVGYYIKPHHGVFRGWKWLFRPGLQVELYDNGNCFAAVRRGDAI